MKTFIDQYNGMKKQYCFKVKVASASSIDGLKDKVSKGVEKYDLVSMSPVKKTILQENPLDFPQLKNVEVYVFELVLDYPATPDVLVRNICQSLGIGESHVVAYTMSHPVHAYTEQYLERNSEKFHEEYETNLGNPMKFEKEPEYGADQIETLMKDLAELRSKRRIDKITNPLMQPEVTTDETVTGTEKSAQNNTSVLGSTNTIKSKIAKRAGSGSGSSVNKE